MLARQLLSRRLMRSFVAMLVAAFLGYLAASALKPPDDAASSAVLTATR